MCVYMCIYIYTEYEKIQVETKWALQSKYKKLCAYNLDKIKANGYNSKMKIEGD